MRFALAVLAAFWGVLIFQLTPSWSVIDDFKFGWAVPFLAAYLLVRRWNTRPATEPPSCPPLIWAWITATALLFFLSRWVQESNLIWRLTSWLMGLSVLAMTAGLLYLAGGRRWLMHFSFPFAFFLVAVPWLGPIQGLLVGTLTEFNVTLTFEALTAAGIVVVQKGNTFEIANGSVGMAEACSGIRSFQTSFMLALFFGELYRLSLKRRLALLSGAISIALLCNIARTFLLVWIADLEGLKEMEKWHDPLGTAVLLACFAGIWALGTGLGSASETGGDGFAGGNGAIALWDNSYRVGCGGLIAGLVFAELAIEGWYRFHETEDLQAVEWQIQLPETKPGFSPRETPKAVRENFQFDRSQEAHWREADGTLWHAIIFEWDRAETRTKRAILQQGRNHNPELCLPSGGMRMKHYHGIEQIEVEGIAFPFHRYTFDDNNTPLLVYFTIWQDGSETVHSGYKGYYRPRLASTLRGFRHHQTRQTLIEFGIWRGTLENSTALVRDNLKQMIRKGEKPQKGETHGHNRDDPRRVSPRTNRS